MAPDKLMVDWSEGRATPSGKSVSRCDPAESIANELFAIRLRRVTAGASGFDEEAHGPPAESVRLKRNSTSTKYKKGTVLWTAPSYT